VREVVVDDLSALTRARLHLKVADALCDDDETIEIIAGHLWAAAAIGVGSRAADALIQASTVAVRRFAYTAAQEHLERAAQLQRTNGSSPADIAAEAETLRRLVAVIGARHGHASLLGTPLLGRAKKLTERAGMSLEYLNLAWVEWSGLAMANRPEAHAMAERLLGLARAEPDNPLATVLGHTAYGMNCWHRGRLIDAAEHADTASRHLVEALQETGAPLLAQLNQVGMASWPWTTGSGSSASGSAGNTFDPGPVRICGPFGIYIHDLIGDLDNPEQRYDNLVAQVPGDMFWELLVTTFAASSSLSVGDVDRSIRACQRWMESDPDGPSQFWSVAQRCCLGAALCLRGDVDRGLDVFDAAWVAYRAAGLRRNGALWLACVAQGLAAVGRLDNAQAALTEAEGELQTYHEASAQSSVLLAKATLRGARGEDATGLFGQARDVAAAQGGHAMAARVIRDAGVLGVTL
jgi:tetratricopeptide (TPR) repeat protein